MCDLVAGYVTSKNISGKAPKAIPAAKRSFAALIRPEIQRHISIVACFQQHAAGSLVQSVQKAPGQRVFRVRYIGEQGGLLSSGEGLVSLRNPARPRLHSGQNHVTSLSCARPLSRRGRESKVGANLPMDACECVREMLRYS